MPVIGEVVRWWGADRWASTSIKPRPASVCCDIEENRAQGGPKNQKTQHNTRQDPPGKPGQTQNLACVLRYWVKQGLGQA